MAIQSQQTNPLILDQNGRTVEYGYRSMSSGNGTVTTAGTPVQLANTPTQAKRVDLTANAGNTNPITVGGSNVVGAVTGRKGVVIQPSFTYTFYITDLSQVYVDAQSNGDGFTFAYFW